MNGHSMKIAFVVSLAALAAAYYASGTDMHLSFESVKKNRELLKVFVQEHYLASVCSFFLIFCLTAFFLPGAIVLSISAGFVFGVLGAVLYIVAAATAGGTLAFLTSRYFLGAWLQEKYGEQLRSLNREIEQHGHRYLFTLRVIPVLPFFVVNYISGLTPMSLRTFMCMTALGMIPASFIYAYSGKQLGRIEAPSDLISAKIMIVFMLLVVVTLLPLIFRVMRRSKKD